MLRDSLKKLLVCVPVALAWVALSSPVSAQKPVVLHIAAAADLQPVMPALAQAYEQQTGTHLEVSFGSSSALATQIINGAPIDVFLGADFTFPEKVIAANFAQQKLPVPYATGTLVLWAKKDFAAPLSVDVLRDPRVTRIAIADEFHAPFGRAAYEALRWLKLYEPLKGKLVVAENVAQTAQFVESGNAQIGFISLTLASSPKLKEEGKFARVPEIYPKISQCAVVIKTSPHLADAQKFLDWMLSPKVQPHLVEFGLEPVR